MFNFLKSHKRKIADIRKHYKRDIDNLVTLQKLERQKFFDNAQEVESHYKHLMDLAKQRHKIEFEALTKHKARPRKCPHCNKEIKPK